MSTARQLWFLAPLLALSALRFPDQPAYAAAPAKSGAEIRRQLIEKRDVDGAPGLETQLWLIEYPPGAQAPTHRHPVVGLGYVIEGEFESAFGQEPVVRVTAGQSFVDAARTEHRLFRNPSPNHVLRFVIAYTLPRGQAVVQF